MTRNMSHHCTRNDVLMEVLRKLPDPISDAHVLAICSVLKSTNNVPSSVPEIAAVEDAQMHAICNALTSMSTVSTPVTSHAVGATTACCAPSTIDLTNMYSAYNFATSHFDSPYNRASGDLGGLNTEKARNDSDDSNGKILAELRHYCPASLLANECSHGPACDLTSVCSNNLICSAAIKHTACAFLLACNLIHDSVVIASVELSNFYHCRSSAALMEQK